MSNSTSDEIGSNLFSASLRIKNCPELHNELSNLLKLGYCHKKGEVRFGKEKWNNDIWILDSPLEPNLPLTEHIQWIWGQLKPHKKYIKELLKNNIEIDLFCSLTSEYDNTSVYLEPPIYDMLCELKIPIEFSIIVFPEF